MSLSIKRELSKRKDLSVGIWQKPYDYFSSTQLWGGAIVHCVMLLGGASGKGCNFASLRSWMLI
jgi:hypothetical protein